MYYGNIFRGLLNDDEENRWTYSQTYSILEGKTITSTPTSNERPKKSLTINNEKVYTTSDVSYALSQNPEEAYELLRSGKITDWIKNGLENEKLNTQIDKLLHTGGENASGKDLIISKLCILLNPRMPIKFKNL